MCVCRKLFFQEFSIFAKKPIYSWLFQYLVIIIRTEQYFNIMMPASTAESKSEKLSSSARKSGRCLLGQDEFITIGGFLQLKDFVSLQMTSKTMIQSAKLMRPTLSISGKIYSPLKWESIAKWIAAKCPSLFGLRLHACNAPDLFVQIITEGEGSRGKQIELSICICLAKGQLISTLRHASFLKIVSAIQFS